MYSSLSLGRMVIFTIDGEVAYDETFHSGVNIIRGDNSSGKSTISHFIFFILGGAFRNWVKEARQCSHVVAEVRLNGVSITLRRYIAFNDQGRANEKEALHFFWGGIDAAIESSDGWHRFGFNSTSDRKSFSTVLFENLSIPSVKGDSNITMHQMLRLLYVDQESPTSSLFLYEQFDSQLTRETVADLLLGVYNQTLYDSHRERVELERNLDDTRREIKALKKFVGDPLDLIPQNIVSKIRNKEEDVRKIEMSLREYQNADRQVRYTKLSKMEYERLNADAIAKREQINRAELTLREYGLEIEDTEQFIRALENKRKALQQSSDTRAILGQFPLATCPECLSELEEVVEGSCKLCKRSVDIEDNNAQARKIEQEISFQIKESQRILERKNKDLVQLGAHLEVEKEALRDLQRQVNRAVGDVKSFRDEKIDNLYVEKGFAEGEILQLRTLLENAEVYQNLIEQEAILYGRLRSTNESISAYEREQERLKSDIRRRVEEIGVFLLNNDLKRQDEFISASKFHIDFSNNIAFVKDKEAKYSASSSFYLKTAARFALFFASLDIQKMRYPRFLLCDNMEDKGIEKERAQNFQRLIVGRATNYDPASYQIIYTTSFIPPEYEGTDLCVGEYYTKTNRSLKNIDSPSEADSPQVVST